MGKFKDENGKTRIGSILRDIGKIVPDVLDVATSGGPLEMLSKARELIVNKSNVSEEDKAVMLAKIETAARLEEARLNDVANARSREVELAKAGKKDYLMPIVGVFIMGLVSVVVYSVFFLELVNKDLAHFIAGEVIGFGSALIFYYYGTSKSSKDKSEALK